MSKVFVLMASSGQYSDQEHWPVAVYTEFETANKEYEALTAKMAEYFKAMDVIQTTCRDDIAPLGRNVRWDDPRRQEALGRSYEARAKLNLELFGPPTPRGNIGEHLHVVEVELK